MPDKVETHRGLGRPLWYLAPVRPGRREGRPSL